LRVHLNYLLEIGYLIEEDNRYIMPNVEEIYLLLPLATV